MAKNNENKIMLAGKKLTIYFKKNKPFGYTLLLLILSLICLVTIGVHELKNYSVEKSDIYAGAVKVDIKDKNFEAEIRKTINKSNGDLYDLDLKKIGVLKIQNVEILDINELKYFTTLSNLEISSSKINNINVLSSLEHLTELNLSNNEITDISSLKDCKKLERLNLAGNQIRDISSIYGLYKLQEVNFASNNISNVTSDISKLSNLQIINFSNNRLIGNGMFSGMSQLTKLYLSGNKIVQVQPLSNMKSLYIYSIDDNAITSIENLGDMPVLEELNVSYNSITNINFAGKYVWMIDFNISNNDISSLAPLKNNKDLECLKMAYNPVQDVSVLKDLYQKYSNFNSIYLSPEFDRTKIDFMKNHFKNGDKDTKKYFLGEKYNLK